MGVIFDGLKISLNNNTVTIDNSSQGTGLSVYIYKVSSCNDTLISSKGEPILIEQGAIVKKEIDSFSSYIIEEVEDTTAKKIIDNFEELEEILIKYVPALTCNCCCRVVETNINCLFLHLLNSIYYLESMYRNNNKKTIDTVFDYLSCNILESEKCKTYGLSFNSTPDCNKEFTKQQLIYKYLGIFFYKYSLLDNEEDKNFLKKKFKIDKMDCCFKDYNINIEELYLKVNNVLSGDIDNNKTDNTNSDSSGTVNNSK